MAWLRDEPLSIARCLFYGFGHAQLALIAGMWYTYLLLYLQFVVELPVTTAGMIFMLGQLSDGFITPLVALRTDGLKCSFYGKRKTVHLIGTIIISLTFPFIFIKCIGCEVSSYWTMVAYFVPLVCLFQSSWAAVQMSHLSLIPELTSVARTRDELNIVRYAIEILASSTVYIVIYTLLTSNADPLMPDEGIGPRSAGIFLDMALIVVGLGLFFTLLFHIFTPENNVPRETNGNGTTKTMVWKDWLKEPLFYKIAILYALSKLITNMLQAFVPLYLQMETQTSKNLLATIPLVMTVTGFLSSILVNPLLRIMDKKSLFTLCGTTGIAGAIWLAWIDPMVTSAGSIYGMAALSGIGGSTMLLLSLSFAADLIGDHTGSGGFVYACLNLTDRIINGGSILAFQAGKGYCLTCTTYYRDSLSYGISAFTMVNMLIILSLNGKAISIDEILTEVTDEDKDVVSRLVDDNAKPKYGSTKKGLQEIFASRHDDDG